MRRHERFCCFVPFICSSYMCGGIRLSLSEILKHLFCMQVVPVDPLIVQVWVSLPFDQILDLVPSAMLSCIQDLFNFVLLFSIDQIRRGLHKVRSMEVHFLIGGEKINMKHVMDLPLDWEIELISDRG